MKTETYNGWTNYETRNVAYWLKTDKRLFRALVRYVKNTDDNNYAEFICNQMYGDDSAVKMHDGSAYETKPLMSESTPDGVSWYCNQFDPDDEDDDLTGVNWDEIERQVFRPHGPRFLK